MQDFIVALLELIGDLGYMGLFFMMFLESSFIPFPSEIAMIPAGYLAYQGEMNLIIAIIAGVLGSLCGALLNYYLAFYVGREALLRYGYYVGVTEKTMEKMEAFFARHGEISTFSGRLIPVVRQYISLPAGALRMNVVKFCLYTSLGAGIWVSVLAVFGYYLGEFMQLGADEWVKIFTHSDLTEQQRTIKDYVRLLAIGSCSLVVVVIGVYCWRRKS